MALRITTVRTMTPSLATISTTATEVWHSVKNITLPRVAMQPDRQSVVTPSVVVPRVAAPDGSSQSNGNGKSNVG
jgi:hypothetical protein